MHGPDGSSKAFIRTFYLNYDIWQVQSSWTALYWKTDFQSQ